MYCIIDFLNVFTTFREQKYKTNNIYWRDVSHINFKTDCVQFFKWFFNFYLKEMKLKKEYKYIFVSKDIGYRNIFKKIIKDYDTSIWFVKNRLQDVDDFICNYLYFFYTNIHKPVVVISADKFKDIKLHYNVIITIDVYTQFGNREINLNCNDIEIKKIDRIYLDKKKFKYLNSF